MEGVGDAQLGHREAVGAQVFGDLFKSGAVAGEYQRGGAVDGGDGYGLLVAGEVGLDVGFGGGDGDHGAVLGQCLHEAAACADQGCRVGEGEDAGDVGGGDFADGVSGDDRWLDAPVLP